MCGRFSLTVQAPEVSSEFDVVVPELLPRYNIAPSQDILVIEKGQVRLMKWGFVPSWSKDGRAYINTRAESVSSSPAFKDAFLHRRVLIPADGFFEWKAGVPYYFNTGLTCFAGVYEESRGVLGVSILTSEASGVVKEVHHRMPVVLDRDSRQLWIDKGEIKARSDFSVRRVSKLVNKTDVDDVRVIAADTQQTL